MSEPAVSRMPFAGLWRGLARLGANPILVKELRTAFRGWRFFGAHLALMGGIAGMVLFVIATRSTTHALQPFVIGREVFSLFQLFQLGVVVLAVPVFAVNAVASERDRQTYDCLITTTMSAAAIVWGKFASAMSYALLFLISALPLVSLCFLFGGVTVGEIAGTYAALALASALVAAYSVFAASAGRSTLRALLGVYVVLALAGWGVSAAANSRDGSELIAAFGFRAYLPVSERSWEGPFRWDGWDDILRLIVTPAYAYAMLFSVCFIGAVNQFQPTAGNRATPMRVLNLVFVAGTTCLALLYLAEEGSFIGSEARVGRRISNLLLVELMAVLPAVFFAADTPEPPPWARRKAAAYRGAEQVLALFLPGAVGGARYALYAALLGAGVPAAVIALLGIGQPALGLFAGPAAAGAGVLVLFVFALTQAALLLSTFFCASPTTAKGLTGLLAVALVLAPLVALLALETAPVRTAGTMPAPAGVPVAAPGAPAAWAAVSPVVAILGSMASVPVMGSGWPVAVSLGGMRMPTVLFCGMLYAVAGVALHGWARRRSRHGELPPKTPKAPT